MATINIKVLFRLLTFWVTLIINGVHTLLPATCEDVYHTVSTSTGVYNLSTGFQTFRAFCQFNSDATGYFFPSLGAVQYNDTFELNLANQFSERDEFVIRVITDDGNQLDAKQEQLQMYSDRNLTVTLNYCGGGECLKFGSGPYLTVTFLHHSTVTQGVTNGMRCNGQDISFTNCDSNPGSRITFTPFTAPAAGGNYQTMVAWRGLLTPTDDECVIPLEETHNFKFTLEFQFGGCGAYEVSTGWSKCATNAISATGASVGLKFKIHNSCSGDNPCGLHGDCVDTIHSYYCSCHAGYMGALCNYVTEYIGCYVDKSKRAMTGSVTKDNSMDLTSCAKICINGNYKYAGLQYSTECFCGDEFDQYGITATDKECSKTCGGNSGQICGDTLRNSVYRVRQIASCNVTNCMSCDSNNQQVCLICEGDMLAVNGICEGPLYVGCFVDQSDRAMQGFYTAYMAFPSPQYCIDICSKLMYKFAGLEVGRACFCDNTYVKYGRAESDHLCDFTYPNQALSGGGVWHLSVYSLNPIGTSKTYSKKDGVTAIAASAFTSVQSSIGIIDCSRIAFTLDNTKSFSYDPDQKLCYFYSNDDGMFQSNTNKAV